MAITTFTAGQVLTAAQMNAVQSNDFNLTVSEKTASYVLVAADKGTRIVMNSASATTITVNDDVFTAGDTLELLNIGAGACTVTAGTATVLFSGTPVLTVNAGGRLYFSTDAISIFQNYASQGVKQIVSTVTGAVSTGTTLIPYDNTIPQITEGFQVLSATITPKFSTSTLVIEVTAMFSNSATANNLIAALFQDSTTNAIGAVVTHQSFGTGVSVLTFSHTMTSGTTSATSFTVRVGGSGAGTTTFNGSAGVRLFGGVASSSIVITEFLA